MNRRLATAFVLVASLFVAVGVAAPASAHTELIGVDPADGSTVGGGTVVTLTFSEAVLTIGAEATVTDGLGTATSVDVTFPTPSSVQVTLPELAPGTATLAWRVVADDGHPVEGAIAYVSDAETIVPPSPSASPATSASPSVTASASPSAPSPSPLIAPAPTEDGSSSFPGPALWIAIFAAVLASSAAILAAKRRR